MKVAQVFSCLFWVSQNIRNNIKKKEKYKKADGCLKNLFLARMKGCKRMLSFRMANAKEEKLKYILPVPE